MDTLTKLREGVATFKVDQRTLRGLVGEASSSVFRRISGTNYAARREPRLVTSPFDLATAAAGPVGLDFAAAVPTGAVAAAIGAPVTQQSITYLVYDTGAFIGTHTDRAGCAVNFFLLLAGAPAIFEFHSSLTDASADTIYEMARRGDGFIDGADQVDLPFDGCGVVFSGDKLPHQRRPTATPLLFLSLCFTWAEESTA